MVTDKLPREQEVRLLLQSKFGVPFGTGKLVLFSHDELLAWESSRVDQKLFGTLCLNSWDVSSAYVDLAGVVTSEFELYFPDHLPTNNGNIFNNITISSISTLDYCNVTFWGYEFIPL